MAEAALARKPATEPGSKSKAKAAAVESGGEAGMPAFLGGRASPGGAPRFLQRQPFTPNEAIDEEAFEDGMLQRMPEDPFPTTADDDDDDPALSHIQTKLEINVPGDAFEREADQVADAVTSPPIMRSPVRSARGAATCKNCGGESSGDGPCPACAAKLQRKADGIERSTPSTSAADAVARPGAGAPLNSSVREKIEPALGHDLSHVRVHSDSRANQAASSIQARAFTHGDHIWLGLGQSGTDLGLMAHEATHTVQQREGSGAPALIQRAPADHRHTEDGEGPRRRLNAVVQEEFGDVEPPEAGSPNREFDRAEAHARAREFRQEAQPDVDRPAAEAPRVERAASAVEAEADQPGEPIAEGDAEASGEPPEVQAERAGASLDNAQAAMAEAAALPVPSEPSPLEPPKIVAPVNADGEPMPPDLEAEARVQLLAGQIQALRQGAYTMRLKARQERANAALLRGNIALVDGHVARAETGLVVAQSQLDYRREVIAEAQNALATSEQKAETVAAEAPAFEAEAAEAEGESGPIAAEASATSAENAANTPDDPEAAADAGEQGGKIDEVAGDAAAMDQAASATRTRAIELQADAAGAAVKNAETQGKIEEATTAADATATRIDQMTGEAGTARGEIDAVSERPVAIESEADQLDAGAVDITARTEALSADLAAIQADFQRDAGRVPGSATLAERNQGDIQRQEEPVGADTASEQELLPSGYSGRQSIDLQEAIFGGPQLTEEQRHEQAVAKRRADERRRARIAALESEYGADLSELSVLGRAGVALELMGDDLFGSISDIGWPDFSGGVTGVAGNVLTGMGDALINAINPAVPLEGVLSGLSKVASGTLNLFDPEQWSRDPLGNLLKSAADIATGITVIFGSILALTGVIMAVAAIGMFFVPALLPVFTFCGNVMVTVGGWTISVGLLALYYQSLLFIKNLVDAMTASTAEELLIESEQLTEDTRQAGEVAMQIGTAALGRIGGAGMIDDVARIEAAGARGAARGVDNALQSAARAHAGREMLENAGEALVEGGIQGGLGDEAAQLWGFYQMGKGFRRAHAARRGQADGGGARQAGGDADTGPARTSDAETSRTPDQPEGNRTPAAGTNPQETVAAPRPLVPETPAAAPRQAAAAEPPRPSRDMDTTPTREPEARSIDEAAAAPDASGESAPGAARAARPTPPPESPTPDTQGPTQTADVPRIDDGTRRAAEHDSSETQSTRHAEEAADTDTARDRSEDTAEAARLRDDGPAPARDPVRDAELRSEAARRSGEDLTHEQRAAEAAQLAETPARPVENEGLRDLGFEDGRVLDNGMEYITSRERGEACRISNTSCGKGNGTDPNQPLEPNALADQVDGALAGEGGRAGDGEGAAPEGEGEVVNSQGEAATLEASETTRPEDQTATPEADQQSPGVGAADGLPARTDDIRADAKAMEGRAADAETTARMEDLGYTPVRNADDEIISYRRPGGDASGLPVVNVRDGRIHDIAHRVPPPAGSEPIRIAPDGEHWIENKDGTLRPVSEMDDPARSGDDGRRHNPELGRWGEVRADQFAAEQGWEKLNGEPTHMNSDFTGPNRLDSVYRDPGPPPRIIVGDAKVMDSPQGQTRSGRQMSDQWIQDRVGAANLPEDVQRQIEAGIYEPAILRVDKRGNVTIEPLDAAGNRIDTSQDGGNGGAGGSD